MTPSSPPPRWGWTGPVRALLIGVVIASALGLALSGPRATGPADPLPELVVDPNTAPTPVLAALPGLGPVLAGRVVAVRAEAPFRSAADLDRRVRGIGPATIRQLLPHLVFPPAP